LTRAARAAHEIERVLQARRRRLLAIDVLARGDREIEVALALSGGDRVEIDRVLARGERAVEIGGEARDAVCLGESAELLGVAPDQDRIRQHALPVRERKPARRADRQDRADEMLDRPHPPGDAVHDDPEPPLAHAVLLSRSSRENRRTGRVLPGGGGAAHWLELALGSA